MACHNECVNESDLVMMSASAKRVLGEYDHAFSIPRADEFVILYGPNGVGKTKFLEIIDALTRLNGLALLNLPFESASLQYSDGSELSAIRMSARDDGGEESSDISPTIRFSLMRPNVQTIDWIYEDDGFTEMIRRTLPYEQITETMWQDPNDGETLHIDELRDRFSHRNKKRYKNETPQEFKDFVSMVPSFLIETQRLRIEQISPQNRAPRFGAMKIPRKPHSRITEQAEKIRDLLNDAQTEHSRITQQLDRTFPNRVLGATSENLNSDDIRESYNSQNDFRSRLGRVASVALADELSLPQGKLEDWELKLLSIYLDDANQKLSPFGDLLLKIELLEKVINSRLLNKRLKVTDSEGLSVQHSMTDRPIELDSLSSGEQHEIILMIDLLFSVPRGAVVLIDEPEISLHVVWQISFIPDVKRIAELAGFRFVVATHSPQIINDEWNRAIRLGPPEVAFL